MPSSPVGFDTDGRACRGRNSDTRQAAVFILEESKAFRICGILFEVRSFNMSIPSKSDFYRPRYGLRVSDPFFVVVFIHWQHQFISGAFPLYGRSSSHLSWLSRFLSFFFCFLVSHFQIPFLPCFRTSKSFLSCGSLTWIYIHLYAFVLAGSSGPGEGSIFSCYSIGWQGCPNVSCTNRSF